MRRRALGALALVGLAALAALGVLSIAAPARAHPLSFAVLSLREDARGDVALALDVSDGDGELPTRDIEVVLPSRCALVTAPLETRDSVSISRRARYACGPRGLAGATLALRGLDGALQVATRIERPGRAAVEQVVDASSPSVHVDAGASRGDVARRYGVLGVEHILGGVDHLLFLVGLLLLVRRARTLVATLTAFTLGHSLSLALAALGVARVPPAAVEACIALSILFVALEAARPRTAPPTLLTRRPALAAAVFGLLHGLGFAGALARVGLPEGSVPVALVSFNVGVELGQLAFVAAALVAVAAVPRAHRERARAVLVTVIGAAACLFLLERLASLGA